MGKRNFNRKKMLKYFNGISQNDDCGNFLLKLIKSISFQVLPLRNSVSQKMQLNAIFLLFVYIGKIK